MRRKRELLTEIHDTEQGGSGIGIFTASGRILPVPYGLPTAVTIRGRVFRVLYHSRLRDRRGVSLHGIVNWYHRLILVDPHEPEHVVRETLLHEVAHVYLHEAAGLKLKPRELELVCDLFAEMHLDQVR